MSHSHRPNYRTPLARRSLFLIASFAVLVLGAGSTAAQSGAGKGDDPLELASPRFAPRWSAIASGPPLPTGRHVHTLTYDAPSDRAIMFGGFAGGSPFSDLWQLSLADNPTWSQIVPTGAAPTGRRGHSSIFDAARDRIIIFGGYDGAFRNDTWELSLGTSPAWTLLSTAGTPPTSYWHSAIYDAARDAMVVFAGEGNTTGIRNDIWVLSFATMTWEQVLPAGSLPPPRLGHSAVYDPAQDRMIIFGGHKPGGGFRNDTWQLSLADQTWSEFATNAPPVAREGAPAIYDPIEKRLLVFGGWDGSTTRNDTWALAPATAQWSELPLTGLPPIRSGAASIYDPLRDRMVVFGGNSSAARNDTWALRWFARPIIADIDAPARGSALAPPSRLVLEAPRPSPFSLLTTVRFALPSRSPVRLDVFDVAGRRVRTLAAGALPSGAHEATWMGDSDAGSPVAAGVYFLRIETPDGGAATRALRLIR
ncbi:MAG: kelch repeat-containing protein [bacterium]